MLWKLLSVILTVFVISIGAYIDTFKMQQQSGFAPQAETGMGYRPNTNQQNIFNQAMSVLEPFDTLMSAVQNPSTIPGMGPTSGSRKSRKRNQDTELNVVNQALGNYEQDEFKNMPTEGGMNFINELLRAPEDFLYLFLQHSHQTLMELVTTLNRLLKNNEADAMLYSLTEILMNIARNSNLLDVLRRNSEPNNVAEALKAFNIYLKRLDNNGHVKWTNTEYGRDGPNSEDQYRGSRNQSKNKRGASNSPASLGDGMMSQFKGGNAGYPGQQNIDLQMMSGVNPMHSNQRGRKQRQSGPMEPFDPFAGRLSDAPQQDRGVLYDGVGRIIGGMDNSGHGPQYNQPGYSSMDMFGAKQRGSTKKDQGIAKHLQGAFNHPDSAFRGPSRQDVPPGMSGYGAQPRSMSGKPYDQGPMNDMLRHNSRKYQNDEPEYYDEFESDDAEREGLQGMHPSMHPSMQSGMFPGMQSGQKGYSSSKHQNRNGGPMTGGSRGKPFSRGYATAPMDNGDDPNRFPVSSNRFNALNDDNDVVEKPYYRSMMH